MTNSSPPRGLSHLPRNQMKIRQCPYSALLVLWYKVFTIHTQWKRILAMGGHWDFIVGSC